MGNEHNKKKERRRRKRMKYNFIVLNMFAQKTNELTILNDGALLQLFLVEIQQAIHNVLKFDQFCTFNAD